MILALGRSATIVGSRVVKLHPVLRAMLLHLDRVVPTPIATSDLTTTRRGKLRLGERSDYARLGKGMFSF
jgi:hypothetical protein